MRALLRSHEQEIVDRVVNQLASQHPQTPQPPLPNPPELQNLERGTRPAQRQSTHSRIAELENQLTQLREEREQEQALTAGARGPGMYSLNLPLIGAGCGSASAMAESVECLFPGVERGTLTQIIENRFKPTNIYRLLASEKDRAESQRTINIGGVEFEQAERDGKENDYRIMSFFKAWAVYTGILVMLAPNTLQGELATAISIYTMNLYDLLEKYTWEGVRAYHFQFHRKRVASGKNIYHPIEWRILDSELVASKCFAHPAPWTTWAQGYKTIHSAASRLYEIPSRDNTRAPTYPHQGTPSTPIYWGQEQRANPNTRFYGTSGNVSIVGAGSILPSGQACRNWNYWECRSTQCRYQHQCISCGSNHKALLCPTGITGQSQAPRVLPSRR